MFLLKNISFIKILLSFSVLSQLDLEISSKQREQKKGCTKEGFHVTNTWDPYFQQKIRASTCV